MSIEQAKVAISVLRAETPLVSTIEDVDALDGLVELALVHLERSSQQLSRGAETLFGEVGIALAVRGQIDEGLTRLPRQ